MYNFTLFLFFFNFAFEACKINLWLSCKSVVKQCNLYFIGLQWCAITNRTVARASRARLFPALPYAPNRLFLRNLRALRHPGSGERTHWHDLPAFEFLNRMKMRTNQEDYNNSIFHYLIVSFVRSPSSSQGMLNKGEIYKKVYWIKKSLLGWAKWIVLRIMPRWRNKITIYKKRNICIIKRELRAVMINLCLLEIPYSKLKYLIQN